MNRLSFASILCGMSVVGACSGRQARFVAADAGGTREAAVNVPNGSLGDGSVTGTTDADGSATDPMSRPRIDAGTGAYTGEEFMPPADRCEPSRIVAPACIAETVEGRASLCNQIDDDCDGAIDEGCECSPGEVQRCFRGPPGRRGIGACQDGTQVCLNMAEFGGVWGPCEGGIEPSTEVCDDLDNDCNGCRDEIPGCMPTGSCPGPGDPRVPDGRPFSNYELTGRDFYPGSDAVRWRWTVTGTPCDRMFAALPGSEATSTNGELSYQLRNAGRADASIDFTLSGDYAVTLEVDRTSGTTFSCSWVVHVRAPGLRVESCWDATGPTYESFGGTVDVDLHLAKLGTTPRWFDTQDCDYSSCRERSEDYGVNWGYADSDIENCTGPGARGYFTDSCPNPRLDIDNVSTTSEYVPENINLDNPNDGDQFRVMVHHFTSTTREARPLVNVYCGGELRGTYGAAPDLVEGFETGGSRNGGDMWRVVDITTHVDSSGDTTGCDLAPLRTDDGGYLITTGDSTL